MAILLALLCFCICSINSIAQTPIGFFPRPIPTPTPPPPPAASTLKQSNGAYNDHTTFASADLREKMAGSFLCTNGFTMTRVDLVLMKETTPTQPITCQLIPATASPGPPDDTAILATANNTITGANFTLNDTETIQTFNFPDTVLTSATWYYIKLSIPDGTFDAANFYQWSYNNDPGGNRLYRAEFSAGWVGNDVFSSAQGMYIDVWGR